MEATGCGICGEPYGTNHQPVPVNCNGQHVFGEDCINEWFESGHPACNTCPICRQELFEIAEYSGDEMESDDDDEWEDDWEDEEDDDAKGDEEGEEGDDDQHDTEMGEGEPAEEEEEEDPYAGARGYLNLELDTAAEEEIWGSEAHVQAERRRQVLSQYCAGCHQCTMR